MCFVLRFRRRLVHVKYMMYRAGELEEEEEEEKKGRKENWRGEGRLEEVAREGWKI